MDETLVRMPKLADTLVEGTLGQWLKQVGDEVRQGEPLASIETDKVTTEISSPGAGTVLEILVAEGQTVPIDTPIIRIGTAAPPTPSGRSAEASPLSSVLPPSARSAEASPLSSVLPPSAGSAEASPLSSVLPPSAGSAEASPLSSVLPPSAQDASRTTAASPAPKPTPVAARLLAEHGLDAGQVTSRAGRLTKSDVLHHLQSSATRTTLTPLSSMRRAIADHMTRAFETIPTGQTVMAADLTRLVDWREQHKQTFQQTEGANLTFTVLFVHALAKTLSHSATEAVNIGVAVAIDQGLIVPVLRAADKLTLGATAQHIADLAARARAHQLSPGETQGAQMTLTNVGSFGNLTASPIVPLSQIGILAPGMVEQRPWPGPDNGVRLGWRCLLSLMFDRRVLDDFAADRLLRAVVDQLESIPQVT